MNIITALRGVFTKGAHPPRSTPRSAGSRSYDLGIKAAELHTFMSMNVHPSVYAARIADAQELIAEIAAENSFSPARFDAGYRYILGLPYDTKQDILNLKEKLPGAFEVKVSAEAAEPIAP